MNDGKVKFIRKNGRIIPIRPKGEKDNSRKAGAAAAAGGTLVAADAARTERVYSKAGVTIDRKKFSFQPMVNTFGTSLHMEKGGKKAASAYFYKTGDPGEFSMSWLGVKRPFRGQGLSKDIMRQASVEMRSQGGKTIFSHVVHPNSAQLGGKKVASTYWKELKNNFMKPVSEKTAMKHVTAWSADYHAKPKFGTMAALKESFNWNKAKGKEAAPAIFREVKIPRFQRTMQPFRTTANKVTMALGAAIALTGAYFAFRKPDVKNR